MSIFSPVNIVGLIIAIFLDAFGILCLLFNYLFGPLIGEALSSISDLIGAGFFAFWLLVKTGNIFSIKTIRGQKRRIIKYLFTFLGESIPFLGALPFWTIFVISEILAKEKK